MYVEDNHVLKEEWCKLYENVISAHTNASSETVVIRSVDSDSTKTSHSGHISSGKRTSVKFPLCIQNSLISNGLRPKSNILNFLLDAVSLKFVELEKQCEPQNVTEGTTQACHKTPEQKSSSEPVNAKINHDEDTTDDEDAFFKSPSLVRYKLKVLERTKSASNYSPVMENEVKSPGDKDLSPVIIPLLSPDKLKRKKLNKPNVQRSLKLDSPIKPFSDENLPVTNDPGKTNENDRDCDILEDSIVTFDATPPAQIKSTSMQMQTYNNKSQQKDNLNESIASFNSTIIPQKHRSLSLSTKKKEAWIVPEVSYHKSSSGKSSFYKKRTKQLSLLSMVRNVPQKNVDVTTLKEHTGGSWSSQSNDSVNSSESNCTVKRKSDEILHTSQEKRDRLDSNCSETFFEISPIKLSIILTPEKIHSSPPSSPARSSTSSVLNPTKNARCEKPGRSNCTNTNSKGSKANLHEKFESTFDIIKDFDRIPNRGSTSPTFKYKPGAVRKKNERARLPGWDCAECRKYYEDLESQMDEREIARLKNKCSKHKSKIQVDLNNTPEEFWDTRAPSTPDLYAKGYIRVASVAFTPIQLTRTKRDSSESETETTD